MPRCIPWFVVCFLAGVHTKSAWITGWLLEIKASYVRTRAINRRCPGRDSDCFVLGVLPQLALPGSLWRRALFFLKGSPVIQNRSSTQNLGGRIFEAQLGPLKPTFMFSRLKVHNLQILEIMDPPGTSSNSIMPIHYLVSNMDHWFYQHQQKLCHRSFIGEFFCFSATLSENICTG